MENNSLLFIGGAGFIGSSIVRSLMGRSNQRIVVLEPQTVDISRIDTLDIDVISGELCDIELIESIIKDYSITTIVHLVSTMVPGCGYDEFQSELESVVVPTIRLAQLCSRKKVKLIFFSSGGTIYGESVNQIPFIESDAQEPISYYGLSKQLIENCILFEHRVSGLDYLILRPSNPYGPGQNINGRQGFIAVAIGKALAGEPIDVWGDGSSIRDYIYIDDLVDAFIQLLCANVNNVIVNIGSGVGHSVRQVIDALMLISSENIIVRYLEKRDADVSNMILDNSILHSFVTIEFTPLIDGVRMFYSIEKKSLKSEENGTY